MAQGGACVGRPVAIDDVYEHDEVAHDAQLEAFFQRTKEWFDVEKEDYDIKKEDEYIERVCVVN